MNNVCVKLLDDNILILILCKHIGLAVTRLKYLPATAAGDCMRKCMQDAPFL